MFYSEDANQFYDEINFDMMKCAVYKTNFYCDSLMGSVDSNRSSKQKVCANYAVLNLK